MLNKKFKASLLHLLISAIIISCFTGFALWVWYPPPFLKISGLLSILLILVTIDLILGPLLTFFIYKPNKPKLAIDLAVIAVVQLAALGYGIHTIQQGHPAYVAYNIDRFTLVNIAEVVPLNAKHPELRASGWWKPIMVYSKPPTDPSEQERLIFEVLSGKPDIDARPEYYEPFNKFANEVMQKGLTPQQISKTPENKQKLEAFITKYGKAANDYAFLPLVGKEKDVLWVWDKDTEQPVGTLDINPWKLPKIANNGDTTAQQNKN
ncbi:MAG: TfpX/TfpZ family type IV pilin accessory protein [Thiolinea sp.]